MALLPSAGANDPTATRGLAGQTTGGPLDQALNLLDPGQIRLKVAGLFTGGLSSLLNKASPAAVGVNVTNPTGNANNPLGGDWRVRISLPDASSIFYKDPNNKLLSMLKPTGGVIFPYTPTVTVTHNARYQEQALTHSNYKNYFYEGSDVSAITITGEFTVQNSADGLYLLAAIYFFRSCTKMFFGKDDLAGNPPPIVYLDGYGDFYFPHVSCVVTSFSHTMPQECDYLEIHYSESTGNNAINSKTSQKTVRLPTTSTITLTVQPVYSRANVHNNMTLGEFSKGRLIGGKGGFL